MKKLVFMFVAMAANFFAASSWFGKPDDLKYLVNKAHEMGIRVLLDLVHSLLSGFFATICIFSCVRSCLCAWFISLVER